MMKRNNDNAFTVIELLVVISVIALLTAILIPALAVSKNQAIMIVCESQLRQLALINQNYANDNNGFSVPGASDIDSANLHRWYGARKSKNDPFDTRQGPLTPYLDGCDLQCPQAVRYTDLPPSSGAYEYGNGGYGYNLVYIGSRIWESGYETLNCKESMRLTNIGRPCETLLFADTAMVKRLDTDAALIRYAFVEPRFFVLGTQPDPTWSPNPSIHFRHRRQACIAWADGHADAKKQGYYDGLNNDGTNPSDFDIGWFEPMDNSLFDLK